MVEGSGPIGLRRDPTAQTVREVGANSRPTRRSEPQVLRIIIMGWLDSDPYFRQVHPLAIAQCDNRALLPTVSHMKSSTTEAVYRDITDFAHGAPPWVQHLAEVRTELGLLVFGILFVVGWWRARGERAGALALSVLAPLATAVGYVVSAVLKAAVDEERPCRAVVGAAASLVPCPSTGDWSFPSNHAATKPAPPPSHWRAPGRARPGPRCRWRCGWRSPGSLSGCTIRTMSRWGCWWADPWRRW